MAAKWDFGHVKDITKTYPMFMESDDCSKIYNVGSGQTYSLNEMLDYIVGFSSQNIEVEVDPSRFRPVDMPIICCDRKRIEQDLGCVLEYSVFDAQKEMFEYYRS